MITYIPQEEVLMNWPVLSSAIGKFWDTTLNFETLPNLKRKLLADENQLWMWTHGDYGRFLFITETQYTSKVKILTVTHTAGVKSGDKKFSKKELREAITLIFEEIEELALQLDYDAVKINARPAHVALAKGYKRMATPIIKLIKEE